jgi:hypothetical protein
MNAWIVKGYERNMNGNYKLIGVFDTPDDAYEKKDEVANDTGWGFFSVSVQKIELNNFNPWGF